MTVAGLLHVLFNLNAQTDFWNSFQAARDFWLVFGVIVIAAIAYVALRTMRYRRDHQHPFGHSLHN